jgi:hypothetical protein
MQAPAAKRSRKPANLSNSLQRDVAAYALAAGAAGGGLLAFGSQAHAQIVYTQTRIFVNHDQKTRLDFNGDGIPDVVIYEIPSTVYGDIPSNAVAAEALSPMGGLLWDFWIFGTYFLSPLSFGARIGNSGKFARKGSLENVSLSGAYYVTGGWIDYTFEPRYLGARFEIKGEVHYGWVRIRTKVQAAKKNILVLITGYAYETQPNRGIRAGDTGQGGRDSEPSEEMISPLAPEAKEPATLGALALGAAGISRWRAEEPPGNGGLQGID